ncbi:PREDICTED: uncharacterized protein LOC108760374 [Trachymyrmex cornetzi]|uniref:Uncharacterized protein n=1 Tax=Trachymyrmex cornetzi TaxID=471704 RepID=A0A195E755_9HYME|nr:PREDICTED: uncharacterized protein LOC108760374 [Trachymyrmex cornetzi]KYN21030.1 hypothetical protein ALC57_06939 [Trachymyrmex cornetzi]
MSLCFRTLPGRLSSLVSGGSGRKTPSKLDRNQLQKNIESSAFLKQFLGTQRTLSVRANTTEKLVPFTGCTFPPNLSLAYVDIHNQWNKKLAKRYSDDESKNTMMYWVQSPRRLHKSQRLSIAFLKDRNYVAPIGIMSNNVKMFQAQSVIGNDNDNSFLYNNRMISLESLHNSQEINIDKNILFISADTSNTLKMSSQQSPQENEGKPSQEQLQSIIDCLSQDLPKLFAKPLNVSIYTDDLVFINNIRGVTTRGLNNYVKQIILLRMVGHMKFAYVKLDIIKITMHPESDTVQVRWRIRGITGWKVFTMFWKYKFWRIQDAINTNHDVWYDGFSTFYVNANGKVYKHIADKMMPDQDTVTKKEDLRIAPKLALFTNLANMFGSNENSMN